MLVSWIRRAADLQEFNDKIQEVPRSLSDIIQSVVEESSPYGYTTRSRMRESEQSCKVQI